MKNKKLLYLLAALLVSVYSIAQTEPVLSIAFLENDQIASVNVNQDSLIRSLRDITDLATDEFKNIENSQKIAVLITLHKKEKAEFGIYSNPELNNEQKSHFLQRLETVGIENTRLTDFPILILLNSKYEEYSQDFHNLVLPAEKRNQEYKSASLREKYRLNIDYAIEALSVLSAYEVIVDDKFAGVKNFGKSVAETNFNENQDISILTSHNPDYWRAMMEMSHGNQLIPVTKIFMLVSQGEFDYALRFIEIVEAFSDKNIPDTYLGELADRLDIFNQQLYMEIQKGIEFHDKGEYPDAIGIYNEILQEYPNSAWAKYELYYSRNALSLQNKLVDTLDRTEWDKAKPGIYKSDPVYPFDVRSSNNKELNLMSRRFEILNLFKDSNKRMDDIFKYAEIAMDLGVHDFAAQLFWISANYDSKHTTEAVYKCLYCFEKLGVTNLKENFKGDFKKEFKKIDNEIEERLS